MNNYIKGLYDMAQTKDANGLSKFDEAKLRRELEANDKIFSRNKDTFRRYEPRFSTCRLYDPCPICDKCRAKASHILVRCQNCQIPICVHTHKNRVDMIRRENFKIIVSEETKKAIKEIADQVIKK